MSLAQVWIISLAKKKNAVVNPNQHHAWNAKSAHGVYVGAIKSSLCVVGSLMNRTTVRR
jgi:hypothetical protein